MIGRKIIVLGRHGRSPQDPSGSGSLDAIMPESIESLYTAGMNGFYGPLMLSGVRPRDSAIWHSDKVRTKYTAQALAAGAFGFLPSPKTQEELTHPFLCDIDTNVHRGLCYTNLTLAPNFLKLGAKKGLEFYAANPSATDFEGVPNVSFNEIIARGRDCTKDVFRKMFDYGKRFGIMTTHSILAEPTMLALVNSDRTSPTTDLDAIGGPFEMEDFAVITLDTLQSGDTKARLWRNRTEYPIDFRKVID